MYLPMYIVEKKKQKISERLISSKKRSMQPLSIEPVTSLDKCRVFLL
jgi:hypothetical protein